MTGKYKHKPINPALILVLLLVACSLLLFRTSSLHANIKSNTSDSNQKVTENISDTLVSPKTAKEEDRATSNIIMPIFMYHYIRDYNDTSDQSGITLSVSPLDFAAQLDLMLSKGYRTTNFYEISRGNIPEKPIILTFDDGYIDFFTNAYPELKKRGITAVVFAIADNKKEQYLNEAQIKELSLNGIEIGAHTVSHLNLTGISSDKAQKEILDSKQIFESITEKPVLSFCYPAGKYNDAIVDEVKKGDYKYAVTTHSGPADFSNPFTLNRYRITSTTHISAYLK